jgi:hypothetical protein
VSEASDRYRHLRAAAERAAQRPFFIARDLAEFRTLHGFSENDLAAWLGCAANRLPDLALCRRPAPHGPRFRHDVQKVSQYIGIRPERLAQLLREVDAVDAFRRSDAASYAPHSHGMLLAARDRVEDEASGAAESRSREDEGSPEL